MESRINDWENEYYINNGQQTSIYRKIHKNHFLICKLYSYLSKKIDKIYLQVLTHSNGYYVTYGCSLIPQKFTKTVSGVSTLEGLWQLIQSGQIIQIQMNNLIYRNQDHQQIRIMLNERMTNENSIRDHKIYLLNREATGIKDEDQMKVIKEYNNNQQQNYDRLLSVQKQYEIKAKYENTNMQLNKELDKYNEKVNKLQKLINKQSVNYDKFIIEESVITLIENDQKPYQILGSYPISKKSLNQFTIQTTERGAISLGIISQQYLSDKNSYSQNRKQCIFYTVSNGGVYFHNYQISRKKNNWKKGQIIQMSIIDETIFWKACGKILNSYSNPIISSQSVVWVPFIGMASKGDKIRWI